jgi:hypothetical protein
MSKLKPKEQTKVVRIRKSTHRKIRDISYLKSKPMTVILEEMLYRELEKQGVVPESYPLKNISF